MSRRRLEARSRFPTGFPWLNGEAAIHPTLFGPASGAGEARPAGAGVSWPVLPLSPVHGSTPRHALANSNGQGPMTL